MIAALAMLVVAVAATGIALSVQRKNALKASAATAQGYRLERLGFDNARSLPFSALTTALAGYDYLDLDGDRYEAGQGGWVVVRKGAASSNERWLVREELLSTGGEGSTTASTLLVMDMVSGEVLAKRTLRRGQVEGDPPTGWVHGHAQAFVREAFGRQHRTRNPVPRIVWPAAKQYEREIDPEPSMNLGAKGDGCPADMKVTYRHQVARLDVGAWELIPQAGLYNDFACSAEHVAVFSGIFSDLEVTIATRDASRVFAFELGTSFDWARSPKAARTIGRLVVGDQLVQFEVQEWYAGSASSSDALRLGRRLIYRVPMALIRS